MLPINKSDSLPSMYDEKHSQEQDSLQKKVKAVNKSRLFLLMLLLLVFFRFFNLGLRFFVMKMEIEAQPVNNQVKYDFIYFSSEKSAMARCLELVKSPSTQAAVVVYTDLLCPTIFCTKNKVPFTMVDMGRILVPLEVGDTVFKMYLSGIFEKQAQQTTRYLRMGKSILFDMLKKEDPKDSAGISFVVKPQAQIKYLDIPYLVYFYAPLLAILILFFIYTRAVLAAFLGYAGFFFLFNFRELFFRVPLQTPLGWIGLSVPPDTQGTVAVAVALFLTVIGFIGLFSRKSKDYAFKEGMIVLLFILLPLALRF